MSRKLSRRRYVAGTGSVLGLGVLAGCADDDSGRDDDGGMTDDQTTDDGTTDDGTTDDGTTDDEDGTTDDGTTDDGTTDDGDEDGTDGDGDGDDVPAEIDDYLADARLYEGSIEDHTGMDEVEVMVGGGPDGLAFDPPAIRIDSGTTVRWEWTGEGGEHNVESTDESASDFSSGDPVDDADETFEQSFDDDGIQLYQCTPHVGVGMLGAIDVVESDD